LVVAPFEMCIEMQTLSLTGRSDEQDDDGDDENESVKYDSVLLTSDPQSG
jgi:hypothetical protein